MIERGNPLLKQTQKNVPDGCQTRSWHESIRFNAGDETLSDRTEQPVVNHDDSSHEQIILNEVNMDFRIPWLPLSVVKHAQSTSVRELIQKSRTTQTDMLFNKIYDKTKPTTRSVQSLKRMIQDVGNVELFELTVRDGPSDAVQSMPIILE